MARVLSHAKRHQDRRRGLLYSIKETSRRCGRILRLNAKHAMNSSLCIRTFSGATVKIQKRSLMPITYLILICYLKSLNLALGTPLLDRSSSREPIKLRPYAQMSSVLYSQASESVPPAMRLHLSAGPARFWINNQGDRWALTETGFELISKLGYRMSYGRLSGMPYGQGTCISGDPSGAVWICTDRGVVRFDPKASGPDRWRFLNSRRWLPDDKVLNLAADGAGNVWVRTETGIAKIESPLTTLREKAARFEERIRQRHWRHGMVASSRLLRPGDLSSNQMRSSDNDGLWTAMYMASQCYQFAATKDADARKRAQKNLQAIMRLETITGIPGFPARSWILKTEPLPSDGEWHDTPDGTALWKGDTSSDEIVGHVYGYSVYFDLVADETETKQIAAVVGRIVGRIMENGWHLLDVDKKPTTWGKWSIDYFKSTDGIGPADAPLNALEILAALRTAHHITQDDRFLRGYRDLITNFEYDRLTLRYKEHGNTAGTNHSDDELAVLSFYSLLKYESDPTLRATYLQSLKHFYEVERPELNPLWNFIYASASGAPDFNMDDAIRTLQRIPMDLISWSTANSFRWDVQLRQDSDRFRRPQSVLPLPPEERAIMKWNGNPYQLDGGGNGTQEDDGAFFLLPYWMGRYYRFIEE